MSYVTHYCSYCGSGYRKHEYHLCGVDWSGKFVKYNTLSLWSLPKLWINTTYKVSKPWKKRLEEAR